MKGCFIMITLFDKDLLTSTEDYIVHQTNCKSKGSASGIARVIFDAYPYADIYKNRTEDDHPGTVIIKGNGTSERYVVNFNSQVYPGGIKYPKSLLDGINAREKYFKLCLNELDKISYNKTIAFPCYIGCGIAGGNWNNYLKMIEDFAVNHNVFIYRKNP